MPHRKLEQQRRLAICELIIELMQPIAAGVDVAPLDIVVLCACSVSTFGPHRLSAQKIANTTGWPLTNVRRSLKRMVDAGRIVKVGTHYEVAPAFTHSIARYYDIRAKGKAIHRTSKRLADLRKGAPIRRPDELDASAALTFAKDAARTPTGRGQ